MGRVDVRIASWIEEGTRARERYATSRVENVIPPVFEACCKIFHPFVIAVGEPDPSLKRELEEREERLAASGEDFFVIYSGDADGGGGSPSELLRKERKERIDWEARPKRDVSWREMAEKYGLVFHNEINPRSFTNKFEESGWPEDLGFPSEGYLPRRELLKLVEVLRCHTPTGEAYIFQTAPHSTYKDGRTEDLVVAELGEVSRYFDDGFIGYLYGRDKEWVVYTDTDLPFTIAAGSEELVGTLTNNEVSGLEALICDPSTRLDVASNQIN